MTAPLKAKFYANYLYEKANRFGIPVSELIATGKAMSYDAYCGNKTQAKDQKKDRKAIAEAFEVPLGDRLKALAVKELTLQLRDLAKNKQREEDELAEFDLEFSDEGAWS